MCAVPCRRRFGSACRLRHALVRRNRRPTWSAIVVVSSVVMAMMSSSLPQMVDSCTQLTSAKISLPEDFGEQGLVTLVGRGRARPVDDDVGNPCRLICPECVG